MGQTLKIPARGLSASELLAAWERGTGQPPAGKAVTLLAASAPEVPPERLARLSIGQRDACLFTLRELTFGSRLVALATCPFCAERLELSFDVAEIRAGPPTALVAAQDEEEMEAHTASVADYEVTFRLPDSRDLDAARSDDPEAGRQELVRRCLLVCHNRGEPRPIGELPAEVVAAVVEEMERLDPQGDVQLALACPSCGREWHATFDIVSFFWSEIDAWAYRMLREVHALASAYGWSEAEILAMSQWRRHMYLTMVGE